MAGWTYRLLVLAVAAIAVSVAACNNGLIVPYDCNHPCTTCSDPCGECKGGECVAPPPLLFEGPVLLTFGPEGQLLECPAGAPHDVFGGFAPSEHPGCPSCACAEPTCELPETLWGNATACPGACETPFDVPAGWDGACAEPSVTPSMPMLSVTLAPFGPSVCAPLTEDPVPKEGAPPGRIQARACQGITVDPNPCTDMGMLCAAVDAGGNPAFLQCIFREGADVACPAPYTEPHVFFQSFEDTRSCTPCDCGPATGSACAVDVALYGDGTCTDLLTSGPVADDDADPCVATLPGTEIHSVDVKISPGSEAGSCPPSGGLPAGGIEEAVAPSTFCCLPLSG